MTRLRKALGLLLVLAPLAGAVGCVDFVDPALDDESDPTRTTEFGQRGNTQTCLNLGFVESQIRIVPEGGARFNGTPGPDCIIGTPGNDLIFGLGGDDVIFGNDGDDIIYGGDGNDRIYGGNGNDSLYGDRGDDLINGNNGDDLIVGGDGNDRLNGGPGDDEIYGQNGNDVIRGNQGNDYINGGNGNDDLSGDEDDDEIWAGAGNDVIRGGAGNDILIGAPFEASFMHGMDGVDQLRGRGGNNLLEGGGPGNTINPGPGNSVLFLHPTDILRADNNRRYACNRPAFCVLPAPPQQYFEREADANVLFCPPGSFYQRPVSMCAYCINDSECDDGDPLTLDYCLPSVGCVNE